MASNGSAYPCVAVDLNTQIDFCGDGGAYPVSNRTPLRDALTLLFAWAKQRGVPIISSVDSHREYELTSSGRPRCCVEGSPGQRKMDYTMLENRTCVQFDNTLSVPLDLFKTWQQVIFRQRGDDLLSNPKADRFITQIRVQRFIVFGNAAETAVKAFSLGLIARNKQCAVVREACGYWHSGAGDLAFRQLEAKGVVIVSINDILGWNPTKDCAHNNNGVPVNGTSRLQLLHRDLTSSNRHNSAQLRRNGVQGTLQESNDTNIIPKSEGPPL